MAVVAATVANDGVLVRPHIGDRFIDADGRTSKKISGRSGGRVMSSEAAGQLGQMMANVVREGSGTAAALEGVEVAGKTGTAETALEPHSWFISFAPADDPQIAVAVMVENGGEISAEGDAATPSIPIAQDLMEEYLKRGDG